MGRGANVEATGDTADWFEFIHSYMIEHPAQTQEVAERLRVVMEKSIGSS